jgi:hypothetical protein
MSPSLENVQMGLQVVKSPRKAISSLSLFPLLPLWVNFLGHFLPAPSSLLHQHKYRIKWRTTESMVKLT